MCIPRTPVENGYLEVSGTFVGGVTRIHCKPGYKMIGNEISTCLPSGVWSGDQPKCQPQHTSEQVLQSTLFLLACLKIMINNVIIILSLWLSENISSKDLVFFPYVSHYR